MYLLYKGSSGVKGKSEIINEDLALSMLNTQNKTFSLGAFTIDYIDDQGQIITLVNTKAPNVVVKGLPTTCVDEASTPYFMFKYNNQLLLLNPTWVNTGDSVEFSAYRVDAYHRFFADNIEMPLTPWEIWGNIKTNLTGVIWNNNTVFNMPNNNRDLYADKNILHYTSGYLGVNNATYPLTSNVETFNFPKAKYFGYGEFSKSGFVTLSAPELTYLQGYAEDDFFYTFKDCLRAELIDIPKCTYMGNPAKDNRSFQNVKLGCVINVHRSMETCNNGQPDSDLLYAINQRNCIVNYI